MVLIVAVTGAQEPPHLSLENATDAALIPDPPRTIDVNDIVFDPGEPMGDYQLTYYWIAKEFRRKDEALVKLYDKQCRVIAEVGELFASYLELEGTGRLRSGRLLNVAGACACPRSPCFYKPSKRQRWGVGVMERPLRPFRSVAVDARRVDIGQTLYLPVLDGEVIPGKEPWGDFVHDGCVIADDKGGSVEGRQLDLFVLYRKFYKSTFKPRKHRQVEVFDGGDKCAYLTADTPEWISAL